MANIMNNIFGKNPAGKAYNGECHTRMATPEELAALDAMLGPVKPKRNRRAGKGRKVNERKCLPEA